MLKPPLCSPYLICGLIWALATVFMVREEHSREILETWDTNKGGGDIRGQEIEKMKRQRRRENEMGLEIREVEDGGDEQQRGMRQQKDNHDKREKRVRFTKEDKDSRRRK